MANVSNSASLQESVAQVVELPELHAATAGAQLIPHPPALLQGVKVHLDVVVGHVDTTLGQLGALKESEVLQLDREADSPVDVVVNGNVIARGQLVVIGDHFGVRILEFAPGMQS